MVSGDYELQEDLGMSNGVGLAGRNIKDSIGEHQTVGLGRVLTGRQGVDSLDEFNRPVFGWTVEGITWFKAFIEQWLIHIFNINQHEGVVMNTGKLNSAVNEYKKINVTSGVEAADPHRLIQMLMQGALEKIAIAKGYLEREDLANKGVHISWSISIIEGLRTSLNMDEGGEVAQNLEDMYEYMIRRLLRANLENDVNLLDEVSSLLQTVKSAWDKLPEVVTQTGEVDTGAVDAGQ